MEIPGDRDNIDIRILDAGITEASERSAAALSIEVGGLMVRLVRLVFFRG